MLGPGEGRPEVVVLSRGDGLAGGGVDFFSSLAERCQMADEPWSES